MQQLKLEAPGLHVDPAILTSIKKDPKKVEK
jgi:hypothetical protein